ncbi:CheR family methyltransferase [Aneurinibacillus terranovensis]|uniref:CheR family methyltransferase n=1 Tax=Aneurinibacillus terranovensis TaxID=278991 RepID=UPI001FDEC184|nr:protein-glutamate O-methyltransferase CheR [Aneurinibacillus terranovensis]
MQPPEEIGGEMVLSDELYDKFVKMVYKKTGIFYEHNKKYYVQKRIEKRAEMIGMGSINDYYRMLKFSKDSTEFDRLINDLTINETYFFRDYPQLRNFAENVLPIVVREKKKNNDRNIKIWSAACSTGEEPYTLSIILQEMLDEPEKWNLQIVASDINTDVIHSAKIGLYEYRSVRDVPPEYLEKYFTKKHESYQVNPNVKKLVKFMKINLVDLVAVSDITGCDFIFCRNVLIYFDDESRKAVLSDFYRGLNPGGIIFLGHSESVGRISSAYHMQRIGDTIVYFKPK